MVLLGVFALAAPRQAAAVSLAPGDRAPEFSLSDIDGNRVTLDQFRGKTVVIAFWSTWCSRCEEELAFLRDTFSRRSDVAVLLVNQDSDKGASQAMKNRIWAIREKLGITFPILVDERLHLWEAYGINALPTSVVIDGEGRIKLVEPNFYWASPENLVTAVGPTS